MLRTEPDLLNRTCVSIVTYNHADYIEPCLESVIENDPDSILVIDSGSSDGTVEIVENNFPEVRIHQPAQNRGYGAGNNHGLNQVDSEYIVVINPDTRLAPDCLAELLKPLAANDRLITAPKILTYEGEKINTIGNIVHFTGLAFTKGFEDPPEAYAEPRHLAGISGACFALSRETFQDLGGFEEAIFIYMDDSELSWNANAAGIDILYVPTAIVYHDYPEVQIDASKLYHLERGRYIILRKYLELRGAGLVLPSLMMTELLTWGYAVLLGRDGVRAKLRAISEGFSAEVEKVSVDQRELLGRLDTRIPRDQLRSSWAVTVLIWFTNIVYSLNHSLVRR